MGLKVHCLKLGHPPINWHLMRAMEGGCRGWLSRNLRDWTRFTIHVASPSFNSVDSSLDLHTIQ